MNSPDIYTVITIDDHPLFRKGVADLISMDEKLQLIGEANSGRDGVLLAKKHNPHLILLDINMREMDGLETLQALKEAELDSHVLMLTVSDDEDDVITALRHGADGYLLKDMEPEDILDQLHKVMQGKIVISERLTELLAKALRDEEHTPESMDVADLTERENEILELISRGMSNKLIAKNLMISEGTVKVHVKHLLKKLHLRSRTEAAVWALTRV